MCGSSDGLATIAAEGESCCCLCARSSCVHDVYVCVYVCTSSGGLTAAVVERGGHCYLACAQQGGALGVCAYVYVCVWVCVCVRVCEVRAGGTKKPMLCNILVEHSAERVLSWF